MTHEHVRLLREVFLHETGWVQRKQEPALLLTAEAGGFRASDFCLMATAGHGRKAKQTAILNALRAGNTRQAAAGYAEVCRDTLYRWLKEDPTFSDGVEKAEADAEVRNVAQIVKAAGEGTWQAAAWWLERRRHEDWKRREQYDFRKLSDAELIREAASILGGDLPAAADPPAPGDGLLPLLE